MLLFITIFHLSSPLVGTLFAEVKSFKAEIEFAVSTNVPAVAFSGKNKTETKVMIDIQRDDAGKVKLLTLKDFKIPVKNLSTGIELRDQHMYSKIFADSAGATPEITFTSPQSCTVGECLVKGDMQLAGVTSAQEFKLNIAETSGKIVIETAPELSLSYLGRTPPSYLGVKVKDQVPTKIKLTEE